MAFFPHSSHQGPKTRDETKQGYLPYPVRDPEQRRAPAARGVRRGMYGMGQITLPATTARHSINARKPRWVMLSFALRGYCWGSSGIDTIQQRSMPRNERRQGGLHNRGITDCCAPTSYYCGVPSSTETKQQTHILPGLESRDAGLSKG